MVILYLLSKRDSVHLDFDYLAQAKLEFKLPSVWLLITSPSNNNSMSNKHFNCPINNLEIKFIIYRLITWYQ